MVPNAPLAREKGPSEEVSGYLRPVSEESEEGLDIGEVFGRVLRGWKILLGAGLIAAVVGAAVVYLVPRNYEASLKLTLSPAEELTPLGASLVGVPKPPEDLLQEYATWLGAPEVLEEAAGRLREECPEREAITAEQLQQVVSISPLKQEGRLAISVQMPDREFVRTVLAQVAHCGVNHVEQFRRRQQEAIARMLLARLESARSALQKAQEDFWNFQREQKYVEKNVRLRMSNRRVEIIQQLLVSAEMELPKMERRLESLQRLLPTLPTVSLQTFRWMGNPPLLHLLWTAFGQGEQNSSGVIFTWETPSLIRQEIEKERLLQQREWQTLQTAYQQAQNTLQEALAELEKAQIEMDRLNARMTIVQREVDAARSRYTAAQEALARWQEDSLRNLPAVHVPPESWIVVKPKGLSPVQRWIGIELLGLALGGVAIFLYDELRRRSQPLPLAAPQESPSETERQPICPFETNYLLRSQSENRSRGVSAGQ
jgi:uncharacterized protein involved in exopolysaccharide biosynthesis